MRVNSLDDFEKTLCFSLHTSCYNDMCVFRRALLGRSSVSLEEIINLISYMFSVRQSFKNESRALE